MHIQEIKKDKRVSDFFVKRWGSDFIISGSERLYGKDLPGFVIFDNNEIIGLLTYNIKNKECEIVTLDSLIGNSGIGTALVDSMIIKAKNMGASRLWLMTTNDNINAIRFYQRRGFVFKGININAIQKSRDLGQIIPQKGYFGIPVRDEIELEYPLNSDKI
jgi:N-acetylglutamate synthase-like GNAT family acetyltransferase